MSNAEPTGTSSMLDAGNRLNEARLLLRETESMDPEVHRALSELVDELDRALRTPSISSPEVSRLADATAHLTQ